MFTPALECFKCAFVCFWTLNYVEFSREMKKKPSRPLIHRVYIICCPMALHFKLSVSYEITLSLFSPCYSFSRNKVGVICSILIELMRKLKRCVTKNRLLRFNPFHLKYTHMLMLFAFSNDYPERVNTLMFSAFWEGNFYSLQFRTSTENRMLLKGDNVLAGSFKGHKPREIGV